MTTIKYFALTIAAAGVISGCSTTEPAHPHFTAGSCTFPDKVEQAPDWYCMPDDLFPAEYWYSKGLGEASLGDYNFQYTVATQNARLELGRKAHTVAESEFFQRLEATGNYDTKHLDHIKRDIATVTSNMTLPITAKAAEVYDKQGNLIILLRVKEADMMEHIKLRKTFIQRELAMRLQQDNAAVRAQAAAAQEGPPEAP